MGLYVNSLYREDVNMVASLSLPWEQLSGKNVVLSGATGMIGSFFTDVLMKKNEEGLNTTIFALTRNPEKAANRFSAFSDNQRLVYLRYDAGKPIEFDYPETAHVVLHLASNTHPVQYATDPIGTITTNIVGLMNLLEFAVDHQAERFVFASSNEIYGENRGDTERFTEDYCGYIDSNTLRAGYPESKRCGEALCQAYRIQKGLNVVIPRLTRTYGPTMLPSDTKALSQFIKKGVAGEDIVLKSEGRQYYSYQYVSDTVSGLFTVLLLGKDGEAYNIAHESSDITLRELASTIAEFNGKQVRFEIPDAIESAGYSTATKARLNGTKLEALGWHPVYNILEGVRRTISILKEIPSDG